MSFSEFRSGFHFQAPADESPSHLRQTKIQNTLPHKKAVVKVVSS
jgi:hypothetical protein